MGLSPSMAKKKLFQVYSFNFNINIPIQNRSSPFTNVKEIPAVLKNPSSLAATTGIPVGFFSFP